MPGRTTAHGADGTTTPERITVDLRLMGPLDAEQRARLADIAKKCPVYKTLTNTALEVVEQLV